MTLNIPKMLVEVCCNSLASALNAEKAGADRIELCSELGVGGVTPSYGLIKLVKAQLSIPVHVLIRPRSGHFNYTDTEFEVMKSDVEFCKELGVDGIVSGCVNQDFYVDLDKTQTLASMAKPLHFSFHRAFDWVLNPSETLKQLEELGVDTILTSGQQPSAKDAIELLQKLQKQAKDIVIMAGGGITPENVHLFKNSGLKALHLSGSSFENVVDVSHKIPMNSEKHLEEHHVAVTNYDTIRQVLEAVK